MTRSKDLSKSRPATTSIRASTSIPQAVTPAPWLTLKDVLSLLYLYPGRFLAQLPSPLFNVVGRLADASFRILSRRRRDAIIDDLRLALGADTPRSELQAVSAKFASCVVRRSLDDLLLERGWARANCRSFVGREHLDDALAAGQGVLLAGLHWQSGRVARRHLKDMGYPVLSFRLQRLHQVAIGRLTQELLLKRYDRFFHALHGDEVYAHDPERSLKMLARLKSNGIVSILIDAVATEHRMELPFLGRTRKFPAGIFYLARAAGCPILPIFSRGGMQALEIEIGPPLPLDRSLPADQFWRVHLPALVKILEAQVRAHPEEWGWARI